MWLQLKGIYCRNWTLVHRTLSISVMVTKIKRCIMDLVICMHRNMILPMRTNLGSMYKLTNTSQSYVLNALQIRLTHVSRTVTFESPIKDDQLT